MKTAAVVFSTALEKHPALGYIGAATPAAAGFWAVVEQATKLGGLVSVALGIAVGIATLRVQLRNKRRLRRLERDEGR